MRIIIRYLTGLNKYSRNRILYYVVTMPGGGIYLQITTFYIQC